MTEYETPRSDWAVAAAELVARGEEGLLDEPVPTDFDEADWVWK